MAQPKDWEGKGGKDSAQGTPRKPVHSVVERDENDLSILPLCPKVFQSVMSSKQVLKEKLR